MSDSSKTEKRLGGYDDSITLTVHSIATVFGVKKETTANVEYRCGKEGLVSEAEITGPFRKIPVRSVIPWSDVGRLIQFIEAERPKFHHPDGGSVADSTDE